MSLRSLAQLTLDKTWHCFNLSFGEKDQNLKGIYQTTPQSTLLLILFLLQLLMLVMVVLLFRALTAAGGRKAASEGAASSKQAVQQTGFSLANQIQPLSTTLCPPYVSDRVRSGALESDGMPADYIRWHQIR